MKKRKENLFAYKFQLLNSQEYPGEINWSSSSSSEYETLSKNTRFNTTNKCRKRKRKKKVTNNISNLDITLIDVPQDCKDVICEKKSPILCTKKEYKTTKLSPILGTSSPMLSSKSCKQKSPILPIKTVTCTTNARKKLFNDIHCTINENNEDIPNKSSHVNYHCKNDEKKIHDSGQKEKYMDFDHHSSSSGILDNTDNMQDARKVLIKNIKSFFDNHFSSENPSQNSIISDTPTPNESTKIDEILILTCKTESNISSQSVKKEENSTSSAENSICNIENIKKIKYKKDGLAYRLNTLLKKQNANISLWQHEKFLVLNSNFVIPKEEHIVFRIQNVHTKYGCHIIEAVDVNNVMCLILINNIYVSDNLLRESILKIYKPYKVLDFNSNYKLIVNICKFDHIPLQSNT